MKAKKKKVIWTLYELDILYQFVTERIDIYRNQANKTKSFFSFISSEMQSNGLKFGDHSDNIFTTQELNSLFTQLDKNTTRRDIRLDAIMAVHNEFKRKLVYIDAKVFIDFVFSNSEEAETQVEFDSLYRFISHKTQSYEEGKFAQSYDCVKNRWCRIKKNKSKFDQNYQNKINQVEELIRHYEVWDSETQKSFIEILYKQTLEVRDNKYLLLYELVKSKIVEKPFSVINEKRMWGRLCQIQINLADDTEIQERIKMIKLFISNTCFTSIIWDDDKCDALLDLVTQFLDETKISTNLLGVSTIAQNLITHLPTSRLPLSNNRVDGQLSVGQLQNQLNRIFKKSASGKLSPALNDKAQHVISRITYTPKAN